MAFSQEEKKHPEISVEDRFIQAFDRKIRSFVRLNGFFIFALLGELAAFIFFIPFFFKSALLAVMAAAFILTVFGYLILRQYLESQKLSYFELLLERFLQDPSQDVDSAKLCTRIAHRLYQREYKYYALPRWLRSLSPLMERLSAWTHWQDVHQMRELLLQKAVLEQMKRVCLDPTSPGAHALLANAYVMLSGLYVDPRTLEFKESERWVPSEKYGEKTERQFQDAAKRAVEEFKILKEYAPKDPWIYMQLAYSYRDLQMPEEEKEAYKSILDLRPNDHETRFNLGLLYFKHGENARGLKVFDELKRANYTKADELLSIYGSRQGSL